MERSVLIFMALSLLAGCKQQTISSSVTFNPHENKHLTATISPMGDLDKLVVIHGVPDSYFELMVGIAYEQPGRSENSKSQVFLELKNNKLSQRDGITFDDNDGVALRMQGDKQLTIYYPQVITGQRTWIKVRVMMQ
jgi:hypothetical protein